ncbi:MAG: hypothetical protein LBU60_03150 [Clostridiales bacterium]|jgi:competence protein ComEC|nr:hypothetical protein [Clostridiales bacterium]
MTKQIYVQLSTCAFFIVVLFGSLIWQNQINSSLRLRELTLDKMQSVSGSKLTVHIVDVGQGDAVIVQFPDDTTLLIDCGSVQSVGKLLNYIDINLVSLGNFLYFDNIIVTSAFSNRVGGLPQIIEKYCSANTTIFRPNTMSVDKNDPMFVDPGFDYLASGYNTHNSASYQKAVKSIHDSKARVLVNSTQEYVLHSKIKDLNAQFSFSIFPFASSSLLGSNFAINNNSPIMLLEYKDKKFVFSGSADSIVEELFVKQYSAIFGEYFNADVIMLGNNGNNSSTSMHYLDLLTTVPTVQSTIAVVSSSKSDSQNYPSREVLSRLQDCGILKSNTLYTAKNSHIAFNVRQVSEQECDMVTSFAQQYFLKSRPFLFWWAEIVLIISLTITLFMVFIVKKSISKIKKQTQKKKY